MEQKAGGRARRRALPEQPVFLGWERPQRLHGHLHGGGGIVREALEVQGGWWASSRGTPTPSMFLLYHIQAYYDKVAKL